VFINVEIQLRFAFKNCIFDIDKQRLSVSFRTTNRCDLLSKIVSLTLINNVGKIEKAYITPTIETLARIANALDKQISFISNSTI